MTGLRFRFEWEPGDPAVATPELRATWSRCEIVVGDACATLVEDRASGSVRRALSVPLYPVAEWIAYNWWSLSFDRRDHGSGQVGRRNVRRAGDGFLWPDLEVTPAGEVSLVQWRTPTVVSVDNPIRYLTEGRRWLDSSELAASLSDLVDEVIARLESYGIKETPLQREWAAIRLLDPEEVEFCQWAARLGLDPQSDGVDLAADIERAFTETEPSLREDFFDVVEPTAIPKALAWISDSLALSPAPQDSYATALDLAAVLVSARKVSEAPANELPWRLGYAAADAVRRELQLADDDRFPPLPVGLRERLAPSRDLTAVGLSDAANQRMHLVVSKHLAPAGQRFATARALWHASVAGPAGPFLLTTASSTAQRIGRAFAAELIAPADGIRLLLGEPGNLAGQEEVSVVAQHFQASELVIAHQIENQLSAVFR